MRDKIIEILEENQEFVDGVGIGGYGANAVFSCDFEKVANEILTLHNNKTVSDFIDGLKWLEENDLLECFVETNKDDINELIRLLK